MKTGDEIGWPFESLEKGKVCGVVGVYEAAERAIYIKCGHIFGQGAGIEADEDIRSDASSAKYGSFFFTEGGIGRSGMFGRSISVQYFPVMKALEYFFV